MLFPVISGMSAVNSMIQRGLEKVKDVFVTYTEHLDETVNITRLKEAEVAFSIDWNDTVRLMNNAVLTTSYARYKYWHEVAQLEDEPTEQIANGKRTRDSSYLPSESAASNADLPESSSRHSRPERPKRKQRIALQPPRKPKPTKTRKHRNFKLK
jgi:hypothetical protein